MSQTVLCTKSSSLLVTWWSLETLTTPNKKKIQSCGSQTVEPPIRPDSYLWTTEDDFQRWCVYWSHLYCGYTHAITTWPQTLFLRFAKPKVRYKTMYIPWGSSPASCQWVCGWGCCEQLKDWPSSTAPLYPWETETQRENGFRSNTGQSAKQPTTNHRYWKSSSIGHMVML